MANSGSYKTDSYTISGQYDGELQFTWTSAPVENQPGKTKIKWELWGIGRAGHWNGTELVTRAWFYINGQRKWYIDNSLLSYADKKLTYGDFVVTHSDDGSASFIVELEMRKKYNTFATPQLYKTTFDLDTNSPVTACSWNSNATVSIEPDFVKPGGEITVSWSGAKDGVSNDIAGFEVWYSLDGRDWFDSNLTLDSSDTNANFAIRESDDDRGKTIQAKVIIKNTKTGFTNPEKVGGSCSINRRPSTPTSEEYTSGSKVVFASNTNKVVFVISPGEDEDRQNCSIRYSIGEDTNKDNWNDLPTNGIEIQSTTYKFWTWDGYEYSEYPLSIEVEKNTTPTVTLSVNGDSIFNTELEVTPEGGQENNNTYTYGYFYNGTHYPLDSHQVGDIRSKLSDETDGLTQGKTYTLRYWVERYDGVETSEIDYSDYISFTVPELQISNDYPEGNQNGEAFEQYFNKKITVKEATDFPLQDIEPNLDNNNKIISINACRDTESTQEFLINLTSDQNFYKLKDFVIEANFDKTFKPYSNATLDIEIKKPIDREYGFINDNNDKNIPKLKIIYNDKNDDNVEIILNGKAEGVDFWKYTLTPNELWGDDGIASSVTNDGLASKKVEFKVADEFDRTFTQEIDLGFNFREAPVIENFAIEGINTNYLKEKSKLTIKGQLKYYNKSLLYSIVDNTTQKKQCNITVENNDYLLTPWTKNDAGGWKENPYKQSFPSSLSFESVSPIKETYETTFEITATSEGGTVNAVSENITVLRHTNPLIRLTKLSFTGNKLTGEYVIDDTGCDEGYGEIINVGLKEENLNNIIELTGKIMQISDNIYGFTVDYNFGTASFKNLALVCDSSFTLSDDTTEYSNDVLNYMVVYNILPTISYRQNHLGINTKSPSDNNGTILPNPVLTVSAYNDQKVVYLVSSGHMASIDLLTGALNDFVIDCGSWSGITGGIIPDTNNNTPAGLAAIAYTGEVADLNQQRTEVVIISGGSATEQI